MTLVVAPEPVAPAAPAAAAGARRRPYSQAWLLAATVTLAAGLLLQQHTWWRGLSWLAGMYVVWSVALPCALLAVCPRRWVVRVALVATVIPLLFTVSGNITARNPSMLQVHDGGVLVTDAAAGQVLHGQNPYEADFRPALGKTWTLMVIHDRRVPNPVAHHYPYLPATFLVDAPFRAGAGLLGLHWDARVLYLGVVLLTLALVARIDRSPYVRAALICGIASGLLRAYLAWGTNDAIAACLFLLAILFARRRPRLAGVLVALAVSFKFLFLLPLVPLAVLVQRRGGWAAVRAWWTLPATLAATGLPFLAAAPHAFLEDTVFFNLGMTKDRFPTSGIGLPSVLPGIFHGPVLGVTTLGLAVLGLAVAAWMVWRRPTEGITSLAGAVALLGVLIPARTFQDPYLTLVGVLCAGGWLLVTPPTVAGREPEADASIHHEPAGPAPDPDLDPAPIAA